MRIKLLFLSLFLITAVTAQDSTLIQRYKALNNPLGLSYSKGVKKEVGSLSGTHKAFTEKALSRSTYYFPIIDSVLTANGLPTQLRYFAMGSSGLQFDYFDTLDGARGLWHFNYSQARLFGLKITSYIDERLDPIASTQAFVRAMQEYHKIYSNWELALAAFCGSAPKVNKAVRYHHDSLLYSAIQPDLDGLAAFVVERTLAAQILHRNSASYKLKQAAFEAPQAVKTIYLHSWCSLDQVASLSKVPVETLTWLNPSYKRHIIPDMLDSFPLRLPVQLKDSAAWIKKLKYVPYDAYYFETKPQTGTKPNAKYDTLHHEVKEGETLESVATTYLVSVEDLMEWNELEETELVEGQKLTIYHEVKVEVPKPPVQPK
ncbi:MAG: LysM peptidoglycan-binding domain-containing protein, partial [Bacteroidota bacterium]|nr:LysM peptidoglycan-binding domain-containing protein [Bacteroidota bacterium]MDX5430398.1 LysM peptidoglycan-binding domain-containing protein [Bacteroidota bacterium]MDX5469157.1 LysM peptidoglycan-binding domain-containing protein [Bacteroidota bacterium]